MVKMAELKQVLRKRDKKRGRNSSVGIWVYSLNPDRPALVKSCVRKKSWHLKRALTPHEYRDSLSRS